MQGLQARGPLVMQYVCEETCKRVYLPDNRFLSNFVNGKAPERSRVLSTLTLQLAPTGPDGLAVFAFKLPSPSPPNWIGVHEAGSHTIVYASSHSVTLRDVRGAAVARARVTVVPTPAAGEPENFEAHSLARLLPVLPRLQLQCAPTPLHMCVLLR